MENASQATQCAEEDNVYVKLVGAGIRRFTIEARHPAYAASIETDSTAPDFAHCNQSHDPSYPFAPKDLTLDEDADYALVGHSFAHFWRPESVDFRVGGTVTRRLHLVQLFRKAGGRRTEILVLHPADGYWRAKPLPPPGIEDTAYGSSFLFGPIEEEGRPFVRLSHVRSETAGVQPGLCDRRRNSARHIGFSRQNATRGHASGAERAPGLRRFTLDVRVAADCRYGRDRAQSWAAHDPDSGPHCGRRDRGDLRADPAFAAQQDCARSQLWRLYALSFRLVRKQGAWPPVSTIVGANRFRPENRSHGKVGAGFSRLVRYNVWAVDWRPA